MPDLNSIMRQFVSSRMTFVLPGIETSSIARQPARYHRSLRRAVAALALPIVLFTGPPARAVQLTPQQEAFFPKNDPIDEYLWKQITTPGFSQGSRTPRARVQYEFGDNMHLVPSRRKICEALDLNMKLSGGALSGGCKIQLNSRLKQAKDFNFYEWKDVDPLQHLNIIRSIFRSLEAPGNKDIRYNQNLLAVSWREMAPVIKRLLERDAVTLRVANIDIADTGHPVPVYGLILHPFSQCLRNDLSVSEDYFLLHADSDDPVSKEFNARALGNSPFKYDGVVYFPIWDGDVVRLKFDRSTENSNYVVVTIPQCDFTEK